MDCYLWDALCGCLLMVILVVIILYFNCLLSVDVAWVFCLLIFVERVLGVCGLLTCCAVL